MASKMHNIDQKPEINLKQKIFLSLYMFCRCFQCKKTPNRNPHYHMESYDTKIKCFGGLDLSQQQPFPFKPKSDELLSFSKKKKRK